MHTPAPWTVRYGANGAAVAIDGPDFERDKPGTTNPVRSGGISLPACELGKGNARLMAAAPEMLEALQLWVEAMRIIDAEEDGSAALELAELKSKAAIQKALGQ